MNTEPPVERRAEPRESLGGLRETIDAAFTLYRRTIRHLMIENGKLQFELAALKQQVATLEGATASSLDAAALKLCLEATA